MGSILSIIGGQLIIPTLFNKGIQVIVPPEPEVINKGNNGVDILEIIEHYTWEAIKYPFPDSWKD